MVCNILIEAGLYCRGRSALRGEELRLRGHELMWKTGLTRWEQWPEQVKSAVSVLGINRSSLWSAGAGSYH